MERRLVASGNFRDFRGAVLTLNFFRHNTILNFTISGEE